MKGKTILCVAAHPDDLEFCGAGAVAKWASEGSNVYYLILTDGSKGSEDPKVSASKLIKTRRVEQEEAAKVLGVKKVFFLDFVDGELENTLELRREIVKIIRQVQPDTVLTMDPTMVFDQKFGFINHPDHRNAGQATLDAVFPFARNSRTFAEHLKEGLKPHKVSEVLLINFSNANFFVDISGTLNKKLKALACHKSQGGSSARARNIVLKMAHLHPFEFAQGFDGQAKHPPSEGFLRIEIKG